MQSAPSAASRGVAAALAPLSSQRLRLGGRAVPDRELKTLGQPVGGHAGPHRAKTKKRYALHENAP